MNWDCRCVCRRAKEYHSHKIRTLMPPELSFISIVAVEESFREGDLSLQSEEQLLPRNKLWVDGISVLVVRG